MAEKRCSACKTKKPLAEFAKNRSRKDGLQTSCRPCDRERARRYYRENGVRMRAQIVASSARSRAAKRAWVRKHKAEHGCRFCEEDEPVALDLHHRDGTVKEFSIGAGVAKDFGWDRLRAEVAKCDVVCANCHRKFHAGLLVSAVQDQGPSCGSLAP